MLNKGELEINCKNCTNISDLVATIWLYFDVRRLNSLSAYIDAIASSCSRCEFKLWKGRINQSLGLWVITNFFESKRSILYAIPTIPFDYIQPVQSVNAISPPSQNDAWTIPFSLQCECEYHSILQLLWLFYTKNM